MKTSPQTSFDKLLARLHPDREQAGEMYEELRLKLVKFFTWKNCPEGELHADEVFDRIARRLDEGIEVQNVNAYAYQVARFVVLEQYRQPVIEELPPPEAEAEPENPRMDCLEECLTTLPEPDRVLILSYYEGQGGEKIKNRKQLAGKLGITMTAIKIRACRLRNKLESCINKCVARQ